MFFARKASLVEKIPEPEKDWNDIANEMMEFAYRSYLEVATDIRDRAEIRQLLAKRSREPYKGKSGSHQCFVHLKTMARVGLLQSSGREYCIQRSTLGSGEAMGRLLNAVPDVSALENIVSKREWPQIAAAVFNPEVLVREGWTDKDLLVQAYNLYERVMATGVPLCSLNTLIETIQIKQIATGAAPISYDKCMSIFRHAQAESPRRIKFHVDRIGRPAFIVLS